MLLPSVPTVKVTLLAASMLRAFTFNANLYAGRGRYLIIVRYLPVTGDGTLAPHARITPPPTTSLPYLTYCYTLVSLAR